MKNIKLREISVSVITAAALLLGGCAKGDSASKNTSYNVPEYSAAAEVKADKPNVYLIVKATENAYFKVMFDAVKDAAADLDCNVYYSGSESSSEWEAQADLMDIAAENGADAVILAPDDTARLADKVSELYDKGIAVICVDAVIGCDKYNVCYMTDNLAAGEQAAVEMLEHIKAGGISESDEAQIAIQTGRSNSQTVNERVAGFCQYWAAHAPAKWTIIDDIKSNEGKSENALPVAEEYFVEYSNIKGVFGTNLVATKGFAEYIIKNSKTDVAFVGFDYCDEVAQLINDSSYRVSSMLQKQYDMAYNGVRAALEIKDGTFSSDSKLVDTGVVAVKYANKDDPEIKTTVERN